MLIQTPLPTKTPQFLIQQNSMTITSKVIITCLIIDVLTIVIDLAEFHSGIDNGILSNKTYGKGRT